MAETTGSPSWQDHARNPWMYGCFALASVVIYLNNDIKALRDKLELKDQKIIEVQGQSLQYQARIMREEDEREQRSQEEIKALQKQVEALANFHKNNK